MLLMSETSMPLSTPQLDEEFGLMTFEGGEWVLERQAMLGRSVSIRVEPEIGETGTLSSSQREAIRQVSLPKDVLCIAANVSNAYLTPSRRLECKQSASIK